MKKKCVVLAFLSVYITLSGMNIGPLSQDIWSEVIAFSSEKNIIRSVCKNLAAISSKNNLAIYSSHILNLTQDQKSYVVDYALYTRNAGICNILSNCRGRGFFDPSDLAAYNDPFVKVLNAGIEEYGRRCSGRPFLPRYVVASYFGESDFLREYCNNDENDLSYNSNNNSGCPVPGCTALYYAALNGHEECVKILLARKDIDTILNVQTLKGYSPLFVAVSAGHLSIVKLLCERPDIQIKLPMGRWKTNVLSIACKYGKENIVEFFLANEKLNIVTTKTAISNAIASGNKEILKLLCENNKQWLKNFTYSEELLKSPNNIRELISFLLDHRLYNQVKDEDCLIAFAVKIGDIGLVKRMVNYQTHCIYHLDEQGNAALHYAADQGDTAIVQFLCKRGANVNHRSRSGLTPLYLACKKGHIDCVRFLLSAVKSLKKKKGANPLCAVLAHDNIEIMKMLLEHEPELVNICSLANRSPLHNAVLTQQIDKIVLLLSIKEINVNIVDASKKTPLDYACELNNTDIQQLLRDCGSMTAVELAEQLDKDEK